jgi:hypothetical protein
MYLTGSALNRVIQSIQQTLGLSKTSITSKYLKHHSEHYRFTEAPSLRLRTVKVTNQEYESIQHCLG